MADSKNGKGKATDKTVPDKSAQAKPGATPPPVHAQVVGQYIKDLSFENPNVEKLIDGPGENPNLKLEVNVNAKRVGTDLYESAIDFKAVATNKLGTIYDLECAMRVSSASRTCPRKRWSRSCSSTARQSCSRSSAVSSPTSRAKAGSRRCCSIRSTSRACSCAVSRKWPASPSLGTAALRN